MMIKKKRKNNNNNNIINVTEWLLVRDNKNTFVVSI